MLISTVLADGAFRLVDSSRLHDFIMEGEVRQFMRLDGWVTVGCHPLRFRDDSYRSFGERRIGKKFPLESWLEDISLSYEARD
jgi:hypothetical protein